MNNDTKTNIKHIYFFLNNIPDCLPLLRKDTAILLIGQICIKDFLLSVNQLAEPFVVGHVTG
jgi:hypothetical protein